MKFKNLLKIGSIGFLISFLGTLPLGTLNIAAFQLSIAVGSKIALLFSLGALIVEMGYVLITLKAIEYIQKHKKILQIANWIALIVMFLLSLNAFVVAFGTEKTTDFHITNSDTLTSRFNGFSYFLSGIALSSLNPMQIPFWMGWSQVLYERQLLSKSNLLYLFYIIGIGIGTFIGNSIFIYGGKWAMINLNTSNKTIHLIIGTVFLSMVFLQAWKMWNKKTNSKP